MRCSRRHGAASCFSLETTMPTYKAPVERHRLSAERRVRLRANKRTAPGFSEAPIDVVEAVLSEGAKFVEEVDAAAQSRRRHRGLQAPRRRQRRRRRRVSSRPTRRLVEGGWVGLAGDPAYGGQGLPHVRRRAVRRIRVLRQYRLLDVSGPHPRRGRGADGARQR